MMYPHEKGQSYEDVPAKHNDHQRIPSTRFRIVSLLLVSLVFGAIFRASHHCIHRFSNRHPPRPLTIEERVKNILSTTPLIGIPPSCPGDLSASKILTVDTDGHNDMPIVIRSLYGNHINNETFQTPFETGKTPGQVDLPRLREGMNGGAFWSLYWMCPDNMTNFSDEIYAPSKRIPVDIMSV